MCSEIHSGDTKCIFVFSRSALYVTLIFLNTGTALEYRALIVCCCRGVATLRMTVGIGRDGTFLWKRMRVIIIIFEPPCGKTKICIGENKDADQLRINCEADHAFVFATQIVKFPYFLNPKFQASNHLL